MREKVCEREIELKRLRENEKERNKNERKRGQSAQRAKKWVKKRKEKGESKI